MKALSIEELKRLKIGDWIYLCIDTDDKSYCKVLASTDIKLIVGSIDFPTIKLEYKYYGKSWLAYKNKEQAECKGELVELPCNVGDKVYYLNIHPSVSLKTNTIYEGKVVRFHILNSFNSLDMDVFLDIKIHNEYGTTEISNTKDFGVLVFKTKEQAEQKLKELRGKK